MTRIPIREALAAAALALAASCGSGGEARRPNVLLLSIDSLRRDHVSTYGYRNPLNRDEPTMPAVDSLAREGVLFDDAVSTTSWTLPSHVAMMTGLPDAVHGVTNPQKRMDPALVTLAEVLGERGYATGGFWSGPFLHPAFGLHDGFDTYESCSRATMSLDMFQSDDAGTFTEAHKLSHVDLTSERLLEESSAWIRGVVEKDEGPFFAFVHWWDPHYDYVPPEGYDTLYDDSYEGTVDGLGFIESRERWSQRDMNHILSLYDAEIRYTSDHIGRLVELLDELGVGDDTLVVLTADHGDEFYDHGKKGHQRNLYDESVRVPLVMRWRGVLPMATLAKGQARLQDIFPTVADLLDLPLPEYVEGRSLVPLWEDPDHPGYPQLLDLDVPYIKGYKMSGCRNGKGTVVWDHVEGRGELFDLRRDPRERKPLAFTDLETNTHPAVRKLVEGLREVEERRARLPRTPGLSDASLTEEQLLELEKLGYL